MILGKAGSALFVSTVVRPKVVKSAEQILHKWGNRSSNQPSVQKIIVVKITVDQILRSMDLQSSPMAFRCAMGNGRRSKPNAKTTLYRISSQSHDLKRYPYEKVFIPRLIISFLLSVKLETPFSR